ncbi:MAG: AP2 domain-containing protein [Roseovarius sp.]
MTVRAHAVRLIAHLTHTSPRNPLNKTAINILYGDKSDNRICNLRAADPSTNQVNRRADKGRRFKGVYRVKQTGKWIARISFNGQQFNLGCHATPEGAAQAYNEADLSLHGEFALLNSFE